MNNRLVNLVDRKHSVLGRQFARGFLDPVPAVSFFALLAIRQLLLRELRLRGFMEIIGWMNCGSCHVLSIGFRQVVGEVVRLLLVSCCPGIFVAGCQITEHFHEVQVLDIVDEVVKHLCRVP